MTTKDYVYLAVIVIVALAFYCNGFYAGVYRCKRMYEADASKDPNKAEGGSSNPPDQAPKANGKSRRH